MRPASRPVSGSAATGSASGRRRLKRPWWRSLWRCRSTLSAILRPGRRRRSRFRLGIRWPVYRWRFPILPSASCGPDGMRTSRPWHAVARIPSRAICAILALGHLVGPLRVPGWRGAIASVSKEKAAELRNQVAGIVRASDLGGEVRIRSSPYPGRIESASGSLEVLSSDRTAGHSSSFDLVIVDETGLLPERARELLAGLRSSVSAKRRAGCSYFSVRGDSPALCGDSEQPRDGLARLRGAGRRGDRRRVRMGGGESWARDD